MTYSFEYEVIQEEDPGDWLNGSHVGPFLMKINEMIPQVDAVIMNPSGLFMVALAGQFRVMKSNTPFICSGVGNEISLYHPNTPVTSYN